MDSRVGRSGWVCGWGWVWVVWDGMRGDEEEEEEVVFVFGEGGDAFV